MSSLDEMCAKLLINGRLAAKSLGSGATGCAALCEAGPDMDAPVTLVLKLPKDENPGTYCAWAGQAECRAALEVQKAGLPTFLLSRNVVDSVINKSAIGAEPDAGADELQLLLARQYEGHLARLGVPVNDALQTRWRSEPRFLFALAGNVVMRIVELHRIFLAHTDVKSPNFLIDPAKSSTNLFEGDVGGAFIDWGSVHRGEALKQALAGDPDKVKQAQTEAFSRCTKCTLCLRQEDGHQMKPEWGCTVFDEQSCPRCTRTAPPYPMREGMLAMQENELHCLVHSYGPTSKGGLYDCATGLAKGVAELENELQIYTSLFAEWVRFEAEFMAVWKSPDKFDRVEYWRRTHGPAEQLLAVWHAGNEAWPKGEACLADVVEHAKTAMKAEMDIQIQQLSK